MIRVNRVIRVTMIIRVIKFKVIRLISVPRVIVLTVQILYIGKVLAKFTCRRGPKQPRTYVRVTVTACGVWMKV